MFVVAFIVTSHTGAFATSPISQSYGVLDELLGGILGDSENGGGPCDNEGGGNGGVGQGGGVCATTTTLPVGPTTTQPGQQTTTTQSTTTTTQGQVSTSTTTTTQPGPSGGGSGPAGGLGSIDTTGMPRSFAGAVKIMNILDEPTAMQDMSSDEITGVLSGSLERVLSPVLPPGVVEVVASPVVIFEALAEALASSGQALIIPGLAFLFGFGIPGVRKRVDEALVGA